MIISKLEGLAKKESAMSSFLSGRSKDGVFVERARSKGAAETWVVTSKTGRRVVTTSSSSKERIKEASARYDGALKRLADR